jgi:hypothetical protein
LQLLFKYLEFSRDGDDVSLRSLKAQIQCVQFIEKVIQKRNFKPQNITIKKVESIDISVSSVVKNATISTRKKITRSNTFLFESHLFL